MSTKKTSLSIELDTSALIENANKAKTAIADLTKQLAALTKAGQDTGPAFTKLGTQLKTATTAITQMTTALKTVGQNTSVFTQLSTQLNSTTAAVTKGATILKTYTDALTKKTQGEQADTKSIQDNTKALQDNNKAIQDQQTLQAANSNGTGTADQDSQADIQAVPLKDPFSVDPSQQKAQSDKEFNDAVAGEKKQEAASNAENAKAGDQYIKDNGGLEKVQAKAKAEAKQQENKASAEKKKQDDVDAAHVKLGFQAEMDMLQKKYKGYEDTYNKLGNLFSKNTIASKAALVAKKAMTIADIAISTEQSVAATILATKLKVINDYTLGPVVGTVLAAIDIATGVADVVTTITNGTKQIANIQSVQIDSKARGGMFQSDGLGAYLTGPGTGISDSINARLSDGESVINARSTQMFGPILSAINQAGGGVAFNKFGTGGAYAVGGLFNGSNTLNDGSTDLANTRAMNDMVKTIAANMPRQVLVVEDVQASLQNKVMLQNMSNF